jgi:hypothetical protein
VQTTTAPLCIDQQALGLLKVHDLAGVLTNEAKAVRDADSIAGVAANPLIMISTTQSPPIHRGCRIGGRPTSWAMPT